MDFSEAVVRLAREVRLDVRRPVVCPQALAGRQTFFRLSKHCEARKEREIIVLNFL
jgi:hypothetical protein